MIAFKLAIKRLIRVFVANALAGGITGLSYVLTHDEKSFFMIPILTSIISAVGKYLREKYNTDIVI